MKKFSKEIEIFKIVSKKKFQNKNSINQIQYVVECITNEQYQTEEEIA